MGYVLGALIVFYCAAVIRKKVREFRQGKFCSCGCCDGSGCCGKTEQTKQNGEV